MSKNKSYHIGTNVGAGLLIALAVFFIFSSAYTYPERRCTGVKVKISEGKALDMIDENDVKSWITLNGNDLFDGKLLAEIDLNEIENRLDKIKIVKESKAYIDLTGQLNIDVSLREPIARILSGSSSGDRFMDKEGVFFPVTGKYSPVVLLLSGSYFSIRKGLESKPNHDILNFVNKIVKDNFWNSQITQIDISRDKEMILYPLYGDNLIEFGKPEKVDSKLEKLFTFYNKIFPEQDWDEFDWVSVKYDGQIVCR